MRRVVQKSNAMSRSSGMSWLVSACAIKRKFRRLAKRITKNSWRLLLNALDTEVSVREGDLLKAEQIATIKSLLRPGDVLLESNSSCPLWQLAAAVALGSAWTHSAIFIGDNSVIDAGTKPYVARVSLNDFLKTTDVAIYRPSYSNETDVQAAVAFASSCLGKPFNITFDHNDHNSFYCTQLISTALLKMPNQIKLELSRMLWKRVVSPNSIAKSTYMKCLFSTKPSLWKHLKRNLPWRF